MPIYEYKCDKCERLMEAIRPMSAADEPIPCVPPCDGNGIRQVSVPARANFVGEGWTPIEYPGPQD